MLQMSLSTSSISDTDLFQGDRRLHGSRSQLMMSPCAKDLEARVFRWCTPAQELCMCTCRRWCPPSPGHWAPCWTPGRLSPTRTWTWTPPPGGSCRSSPGWRSQPVRSQAHRYAWIIIQNWPITWTGTCSITLTISSACLSARTSPFSTTLNFPVVLLMDTQVCLHTWIKSIQLQIFLCTFLIHLFERGLSIIRITLP